MTPPVPAPPPNLGIPESHTNAVLPVWFVDHVEQERDFDRARYERATQIILALRRKLRAQDPTLPSEFDGTAWAKVEADFLSEDARAAPRDPSKPEKRG